MCRPITMRNSVLSLLGIAFFLCFIPFIAHADTWNGWIYQDPYPTSANLFDVKFVTPLKGWITGKYGTILYTEDGGDTWESQESGTEEDIMRVCFVNEKMGWAAGERGAIIHTEDGGKKWTTQFNIKALPTKIFFINEKEGWVSGSSPMGVVYSTKDGGKTWQEVETEIERAIGSIYFVNSQTGWVLAGEDVYRTTDGGNTWKKSRLANLALFGPMGREDRMVQGLGNEFHFGEIVFANENKGWAVISRWVFHSEDGGKTWKTQLDAGALSYGLGHITFSDTQNGCVSGYTIYCTEDGGKTWKERLGLKPPDSKVLGGISLTDRLHGWAVGNFGQIMKTRNSGRSWEYASKKNDCGPGHVFINSKTGWFYNPRRINVLCRTDDGGQTMQKQNIGIKVQTVFFKDSSTGWAVGITEKWKDGKDTDRLSDRLNVWGVIKHTTDGGKTWIKQYHESMGKDDDVSLSAPYFFDNNIGWVIGTDGMILRTTDGGKHWEHQKSGVRSSLWEIQFINYQQGWIVGTQYGDNWTAMLLHTEDAGNQWKVQHKRRDFSFRDLFFMDDKSGWIVGGTESGETGIVLVTKDGGITWIENRFNHIDLFSLKFLNNEEGVIFSDEEFILVTTDGGKTWNKQRKPLKKNPWHLSELFQKATQSPGRAN